MVVEVDCVEEEECVVGSFDEVSIDCWVVGLFVIEVGVGVSVDVDVEGVELELVVVSIS